jgi:hypothetical protein
LKIINAAYPLQKAALRGAARNNLNRSRAGSTHRQAADLSQSLSIQRTASASWDRSAEVLSEADKQSMVFIESAGIPIKAIMKKRLILFIRGLQILDIVA